MRDDRHSGITQTGNLGGERIALGIDEADMGHLMVLLTDLYSDPELAVIREYSTNALDAHRAAGNPAPIEVTTPTDLLPYLTITDHGTGLSREDIRDVYSRYGKSTKTDANNETGMFGLGCKSALTYAPQFTVTGVKDGRRVQVAVSREDDGAGAMRVVSDEPTDDGNGVTVTIPCERVNRIRGKAEALFAHWPEGSVLLDGKPVNRIDGLWLTKQLCVVDRQEHPISRNTVVMGGVAYPVDFSEADAEEPETAHGQYVVAYLDIGDVHPTPNRESLAYTEKTKARIQQLVRDFAAAAQTAAEADVAACATAPEALLKALEWRNRIPAIRAIRYGGKDIPARYGTDKSDWRAKVEGEEPIWVAHVEKPAYQKDCKRHFTLDVDRWHNTVFISGFDIQSFSPTAREKARHLLNDRGVTAKRIVASRIPVPVDWVAPTHVLDYADVKAVQLPGQGRVAGVAGSARPRGSYDGYAEGEQYARTISADEIEAFTGKVYWTPGGMYGGHNGIATDFAEVATNYLLIVLPDRRVAKFERDFPAAKRLGPEHWQPLHDAWWNRLGDATKHALALHEGLRYQAGGLKALDPKRLVDPELKAAAVAARTDIEAVKAKRYAFINRAQLPELPTVTNPLESYPLFDQHKLRAHPHATYDYLADAYARRIATQTLTTTKP